MTRRLPLTSLLLGLLLFAACAGGDDGPSSGWNLGRRRPDTVIRQPGVLVPDWMTQWGAYGPGTWESFTSGDQKDDGAPFVFANRRVARLVLMGTFMKAMMDPETAANQPADSTRWMSFIQSEHLEPVMSHLGESILSVMHKIGIKRLGNLAPAGAAAP